MLAFHISKQLKNQLKNLLLNCQRNSPWTSRTTVRNTYDFIPLISMNKFHARSIPCGKKTTRLKVYLNLETARRFHRPFNAEFLNEITWGRYTEMLTWRRNVTATRYAKKVQIMPKKITQNFEMQFFRLFVSMMYDLRLPTICSFVKGRINSKFQTPEINLKSKMTAEKKSIYHHSNHNFQRFFLMFQKTHKNCFKKFGN